MIIRIINFYLIQWVHCLNPDNEDRIIIEQNGLLSDKRICAAQKLICKQFPHISGLQSPLISQTRDFCPVSVDSTGM